MKGLCRVKNTVISSGSEAPAETQLISRRIIMRSERGIMVVAVVVVAPCVPTWPPPLPPPPPPRPHPLFDHKPYYKERGQNYNFSTSYPPPVAPSVWVHCAASHLASPSPFTLPHLLTCWIAVAQVGMQFLPDFFFRTPFHLDAPVADARRRGPSGCGESNFPKTER